MKASILLHRYVNIMVHVHVSCLDRCDIQKNPAKRFTFWDCPKVILDHLWTVPKRSFIRRPLRAEYERRNNLGVADMVSLR